MGKSARCWKIKLTGRKIDQKNYYRYSGFIGGMKEQNAAKKLAQKPEDVIRLAVRRMMPKNRLARQQLLHRIVAHAVRFVVERLDEIADDRDAVFHSPPADVKSVSSDAAAVTPVTMAASSGRKVGVWT